MREKNSVKMKINKTHVGKSNAKMRIVIIALAALIYLIPGSARAAVRIEKHQPVSLIIETFDHQNIFDDSSSDIYISNNDESSSEGESSSKDESTSKDEKNGKSSSKDEKNDEEEDDDDWEA